MIVVRVLGGLGNQMFQYAYAKALEHKGFNVKLDISKFKKYKLHGGYQLDKYNINLENADALTSTLGKLGLKKSVKENSLLFDKNLLSLTGNEYVKGYFQTEKYFLEIREILLKDFVINKEIAESTKKFAFNITSSKNTCSLHIRRGDYISDEKANSVHGTCSLEYYKKAIEIILQMDKNTRFFVFSDDINWTKENLKIENTVYIDHKTLPHEDIYLMSLCKNNITANSSFSWWAAWLNTTNNKTVIAPKQWFVNKENEIACSNWIKI